VTHPDDVPAPPDGPTPAREQLPLPRRRRQSHIEPQLRTPGGAGTGTPFAAFGSDAAPEPARSTPPDCYDRGGHSDRAAAFSAGAHRGRGGPHHTEHQPRN
jgi:hypothetical protein